jgi:uncharacterized protein involved in outer membrane biogenesis
MRPLRWIAVAGGALVALLLVAALVAHALIDTDAIRRHAESEVARMTGRQMSVRALSVDLWPRLSLVAQDVALANPPGASRPNLVVARSVRGAVSIFPLLRSRTIVVESLEVDGLDLALETAKDGRGNWTFTSPGTASTSATPSQGGAMLLRLAGTVALVDGKASWRAAGGDATTMAIPRFEVSPATEGRYAWKGAVDADGVRWSIDATTGDPVVFARNRVPFEVDARIAGGGVALSAKGRVEQRDSGVGVVADAAVAWSRDSQWLRHRAPRLAADEGRVSGRVEAREKQVTFDGIAGSVANSKFDGTLTVDLRGKVPKLEGRLHADLVDLAREVPSSAPQTGTPAPPTGGEPPVSRLAKLDADVDFVIDRLALPGGFEATALRGRVVVDRGKLAADPVDLAFGGGTITARVHADAASGRGRIVADGRGIELARAAPKLEAGKLVNGGATAFAIDLQGPARDASGFVAGSSGTIRAEMGPMRVRGIALDAGGDAVTRIFDAVNPFRRVDPSTDVQCAVVRLAVQGGVAHADRTIAVETSRLTVSASGTIDLRDQTLDLLVRPRARKIASLPTAEIADVIRVTGPIRKPSYRLDTLGAAKAAATIGGAVASGGWSLLASPLLNAGDDKSPCATARAGGKVQSASPASPNAPAVDPLTPILRGLFKR